MRKALVGASVVALAMYSVDGLADEPVSVPPPTTQPAPTPAAQPPQPSSVQSTQMAQAATPIPASTTTTTSAVTAPDPASTGPREKETVTLYQKFRPNRPWLYTGGALFLGSYVTTAVFTAVNDLDRTMFIPVVGPWLHLADQGSSESTTDTLLTAGSGVIQGAGVIMATASLFIPEKIPAATIQAGNTKINFTPTSYGRGSAGLGVVGRF
jgi:hypothetical protein